MTTLVFTTSTAEAMAKQCATFLKEYCRQQNGNCVKCKMYEVNEREQFCKLYADRPKDWEVSDD